jgi:hypothetical protein
MQLRTAYARLPQLRLQYTQLRLHSHACRLVPWVYAHAMIQVVPVRLRIRTPAGQVMHALPPQFRLRMRAPPVQVTAAALRTPPDGLLHACS